MTKKIVVTEDISLEGVIELGNWTDKFSRGPEGDKFKLEELQQADSLIFGRVTYEAFAGYWPQSTSAFAAPINSLPKIVASGSLKDPGWGKPTRWDGDIVSAARAFRAQGDGTALIYGSASVVHQLASAGLIDEYRLMIYPTIVGAGKRLFPDGVKSTLSLMDNRQFGDGIVLLRYKPV